MKKILKSRIFLIITLISLFIFRVGNLDANPPTDLKIIDFFWSPQSPVAGEDNDINLTIYFKCGENEAAGNFNVSLKINGKPFKDLIITYNPILTGTGWRINFSKEKFTNEFYRACVKGENELYVKIDSENDIEETDETNNELFKKIYVYDIIPPELTIKNPANNDVIRNIIYIKTCATDNIKVEKVEFYIDSSHTYTAPDAPYEWDWETHSVENGEHSIKVIASDTFGNTTAKSIEVLVNNEAEKAWIKVPKDGKRIRGNAVTIMAETTKNVDKVLFQYRKENDDKWVDISSIDEKKPFSVYWNVSGLDNGSYDIRAIAYDKYGYPDTEPASISIIVDDVNWDIDEDGNPDVDPNKPHRKCEKFSPDTGATVTLADGTEAVIPAGINISAESIEIVILNPDELSNTLPPEESSLKSIGVFREYKFSDNSRIFNKKITLIFPYPDEDKDGIVDGTEIPAETLKPYWFDEEKEIWIPVEETQVHSVHSFCHSEKSLYPSVKVKVNHFTIFSLMGSSPQEDLKNIIVYPNPYKPNSGLGHTHIYFDGLTEKASVKIYTITGRLINEITEHNTPGKIEWEVLNNDNNKVVSGVYLYVVTDEKNKPATGKFAIIR